MSIEDLKPVGFNEGMRAYADVVKPWRMYVQGFALRECGVWLNVDGVNTLIGAGLPDEALAEAESAVETMLASVRRQIAERKRDAP